MISVVLGLVVIKEYRYLNQEEVICVRKLITFVSYATHLCLQTDMSVPKYVLILWAVVDMFELTFALKILII